MPTKEHARAFLSTTVAKHRKKRAPKAATKFDGLRALGANAYADDSEEASLASDPCSCRRLIQG